MNGKPLPVDSTDMKAMVEYFDWMKNKTKPEDKVAGRGIGKIDMAIKPNVENGKLVCEAQHAYRFSWQIPTGPRRSERPGSGVDVAEYFSHQPRPDFPDKIKDWPKGKKPADARY
jgi:thiosulfate dehydrogenase